jgi:exopolysaccharide/PEP-CTERM locus tyrosine autokinase
MGNLFKTLLNEKIISIGSDDKTELKNSGSQNASASASVEKTKRGIQKSDPEIITTDVPLPSDEKMKREIIFSRARSNKMGSGADIPLKAGLASKNTKAARLRRIVSTRSRELGNITKFPLKRRDDLLTVSQPSSAIAETFKVIRTLLLMKIRERGVKTVLVTSSLPLEGKSFVAANLAVSVALDFDKYVLLVDADVKRPTLHEIFKTEPKLGLTDYLMNGHHNLVDLIQTEILTKLSFIPAGSFQKNSSELLASQKMKQLMKEVKDRYDDRYIIFDSPPAQISETLALANFVDGVLLVVKAGETAKKLVKKTVAVLGRDKILGVVLNQCDVTPKAYYQYYVNQL